MSNEQDTEVLEQETVESTETTETKLEDFFSKLDSKPTAEAVDAEPETEGEPADEAEQPESDAVKVEGPSVAMKMFAKQQGLPAKAIELAKSDEDLSELVEVFVAKQAQPEPTPEPEPEFKLELSEEDFPADDPIRKAVESLNSHYEAKVKKLEGYIGQLADMAFKAEETLKASEVSQLSNDEKVFDDFIDALGVKPLGNRAKGEISSIGQKLRNSLYWEVKDLEAENPSLTREAIIRKVAEEAGYLSPQQKREQAIKSDSARRLGGGGSKPVPASPPTAQEKMNALFDRLDAAKK